MKNFCESFRKKCYLLHYTIVKFKPNLNESLVWVLILSQLLYVKVDASLASFCYRVCYGLLKSWGKRKSLVTRVTCHHKYINILFSIRFLPSNILISYSFPPFHLLWILISKYIQKGLIFIYLIFNWKKLYLRR